MGEIRGCEMTIIWSEIGFCIFQGCMHNIVDLTLKAHMKLLFWKLRLHVHEFSSDTG